MADEFVLFLCEDCPGEICYIVDLLALVGKTADDDE